MSQYTDILRKVFLKNETSNPYSLQYAAKGGSGYSYGLCQNDAGANTGAYDTLWGIISA